MREIQGIQYICNITFKLQVNFMENNYGLISIIINNCKLRFYRDLSFLYNLLF